MTKEVQAAVQLIQKNILDDNSLTRRNRAKALKNIEDSILNMDESLVTHAECINLRIYTRTLFSKLKLKSENYANPTI